MNVRLVIEQRGRRKVLTVHPPEAVLGRSHGNTVRIPSADVSRRHCRLVIESGLVTLEDLGSVNGTFLNGRRVRDSEVVRPGDNLEVGPASFVVEYDMTPEALDRLREMDSSPNEMDALAALAEGESLEEVPDDEEAAVPVLESIEDDAPPAPISADDEDIKVDFDFETSGWQMPEGGDLRDLLSEDEIEEEPTRHIPPKKKPR